MRKVAIRGWIVLPSPQWFDGATAIVGLDDVTLIDALSTRIAETVIEGIQRAAGSHSVQPGSAVGFPGHRDSYVLAAEIRCSGRDRLAPGDFLTTVAVPWISRSDQTEGNVGPGHPGLIAETGRSALVDKVMSSDSRKVVEDLRNLLKPVPGRWLRPAGRICLRGPTLRRSWRDRPDRRYRNGTAASPDFGTSSKRASAPLGCRPLRARYSTRIASASGSQERDATRLLVHSSRPSSWLARISTYAPSAARSGDCFFVA